MRHCWQAFIDSMRCTGGTQGQVVRAAAADAVVAEADTEDEAWEDPRGARRGRGGGMGGRGGGRGGGDAGRGGGRRGAPMEEEKEFTVGLSGGQEL